MPYTPPDPAVVESNLETFEKLAPNGDGAAEPETVLDGEPTEPETLAPHLVLELDGDRQTFPSKRQANQFLLVRHADDLSAGGFATVRAVTILALGQVLKSERARLEGYLAEHGSADDYTDHIYDALSACWAGETQLPLAPSSGSSERTETATTV